MEMLWIITGGILMLVGLAGCILPFLPGPPLCYVALLLQQLRDDPPFTSKFLWIWAGVTIVVIIIEYIIPVYGTKKFGGTKYGVWGCTIGLVVGLFFGPIGIIAGPFVGALAGELIGNANSNQAMKAALGSFIGFLAGTVLKLIVCGVMVYYYIGSL
jgi:uncharacterized protein